MSFRNCPHCRSSNRSSDKVCYSCRSDMDASTGGDSDDFLLGIPVALGGTSDIGNVPAGKPLGALACSVAIGGLAGFLLPLVPFEIGQAASAFGLCLLVAVLQVALLVSWAKLPPGFGMTRGLPAGLFGGLVGLYLGTVCWYFEPGVTSTTLGLLAGFSVGIPLVVSFGFAGGASRPMGMQELQNFAKDSVAAVLVGGALAVSSGAFDLIFGFMAAVALLATVLSGRANCWQIHSAFRRWNASQSTYESNYESTEDDDY